MRRLVVVAGFVFAGFQAAARGQVVLKAKGGIHGTFDPENYGAICDGASRPLSNYFSSLSAAQVVYPWVTDSALTDEIDGVAIQGAIFAAAGGYTEALAAPESNSPYQYGGPVVIPARMCRANKTIFVPSNTKLLGLGSGINAMALPSPVSGARIVQSTLIYWMRTPANDDQPIAVFETWNKLNVSGGIPPYTGTVTGERVPGPHCPSDQVPAFRIDALTAIE